MATPTNNPGVAPSKNVPRGRFADTTAATAVTNATTRKPSTAQPPLIACRQGLLTRGGASGVGESCTKAVVQGSMFVLVMNFVLTLLSNKLYFLIYG